ncbi:MAG TPA: hypothetical protein VKB86_17085 [Pyrinomonadaceae bacterium]|nr:hypothetical protein [Pyrinomonadaceae bacterium]
MFDWQTIATALIILAALIYTGRLAWLRLRTFRAGRDGATSCETGCGSCGEKPKQVTTQRTVFVEISRSSPSSRPNIK